MPVHLRLPECEEVQPLLVHRDASWISRLRRPLPLFLLLVAACVAAGLASRGTQLPSQIRHQGLALQVLASANPNLCPGGNSVRWAAHPEKCIAVDTGEKFLGSRLYLWDCIPGFPNEQFILPSPGKEGPIRWAGDLSKCVDVQDGKSDDGTHLQLWDCFKGNMNQRFISQEGTGLIKWAKNHDKCFTVLGGKPTTGSDIVLWSCDAQSGQSPMSVEVRPAIDCTRVGRCTDLGSIGKPHGGQKVKSSGSGPIRLFSVPTKCMSVRPKQTLEIHRCVEGHSDQEFLLPPSGSGTIRWAADPQSCLEALGEGVGAAVGLRKCGQDDKRQEFAVADFPGPIRWVAKPDLCISVRLGSLCNGNSFSIRRCGSGMGPGLKFDVHSRAFLPSELAAAHRRGDLLYTHSEAVVPFKPEVGNGFIATVVGSNSLFAAGIFNGCMTDSSGATCAVSPSRRARIPTPLNVRLGTTVTGAALDLVGGSYIRFHEGGVRLRYYAHRARKSLLVAELSLPKADAAGLPESSANSSDNDDAQGAGDKVSIKFEGGGHPQSEDFDWDSASQKVAGHHVAVWTGVIKETELPDAEKVKVVVVLPKDEPTEVALQPGESTFFVSAVRTSLEAKDPKKAALDDFKAAMDSSAEALLDEHTAAWGELWESGFEVDGRMDVARTVNSSLYYILSSLREDATFSLSPGGLASNAYLGHTFWDTEMWMLPSLTLWHPGLAASLLEYRVRRLEQAYAKAKSYHSGYSGAMYTWESAATGFEECPTWSETGQLEQHITADLAFAQEQLWHATHNKTQLQSAYKALVKETADFWTSRVEWADGEAHIRNVIPPDEFAKGNDSAYTNFAAQRNLLFAINASDILDKEVNPAWNKTAAAVPVLFDKELGIHPEFDGYSGAKIKQADVVLLGFPLMMDMPASVRRADLEYYSSRTDPNGPAMTWSMHAIGWLELGAAERERANKAFNQGFANAQKPFYVWTETPSGGAVNFITGAGGFLQSVMYGLAGLRIWPNRLEISPTLLEGMKSVSLRGIHYRGSVLRLTFDPQNLTITCRSGEGLTVRGAGNVTSKLSSGGSVVLPMSPATLWPADSEIRTMG